MSKSIAVLFVVLKVVVVKEVGNRNGIWRNS